MSIKVTEKWSESRLSLAPPWEAVRVFEVTGTDDELDALQDEDIPQHGDEHPAVGERLLCDGPRIRERKGPEFFVIECHYTLEVGQFAQEDFETLNLPPKITWTTVRETVEVDHDLDNKAIINGAGELMRGSRTITYKHLRIVRFMPYYDILLSKDFECSVNDREITVQGITFAKEHIYCCTIEPAIQEYTNDAPYLPIAFDFDVMAEDVLGKYPFQMRFLNAGKAGWYLDDSSEKVIGKLVNKNGEPLDFDVKLSDVGEPLTKPYGSGAIKVGAPSAGNTEVHNPIDAPVEAQPYATEFYKGDGTKQDTIDANTEAVFFYYKGAHVRDFTDLISALLSTP